MELNISFILLFNSLRGNIHIPIAPFLYIPPLFVSSRVLFIEPVILSAYRIASPFICRAARPTVCIKERSERRKPSLSASNYCNQRHLGKVQPLSQEVYPISTSNSPIRGPLIISTRSSVAMSECRYLPLCRDWHSSLLNPLPSFL